MFTGKVVGSVVSTVKDENLKGIKLLIVQVYDRGRPIDERLIIAADATRVAGHGDYVYMLGSKEAILPFRMELIPVDASIVGIVDKYNVDTKYRNEDN